MTRGATVGVIQRDSCGQPRSAWDLKKAWGEGLDLQFVEDAGHSAKEPGIAKLLTEVGKDNRGICDTCADRTRPGCRSPRDYGVI
jgi:hypothetical protein